MTNRSREMLLPIALLIKEIEKTKYHIKPPLKEEKKRFGRDN